MTDASDVDTYIAGFAPPVREPLVQMRETILAAVPDLEEKISYGMPAYARGRILVYFSAAKNHIGFYPTASGLAGFQEEFTALGLKWSKGAVQFPLGRSLPLDLVTRITRFRAAEDAAKVKK